MFVRGHPAIIDEWVIVDNILGGLERAFTQHGVHEKCTINVSLRFRYL